MDARLYILEAMLGGSVEYRVRVLEIRQREVEYVQMTRDDLQAFMVDF